MISRLPSLALRSTSSLNFSASLAAERATLLATALLFFLPFVNPIHRGPSATFDSEWLAALCLTLAFSALALVRGHSAEVRWPLPLLLAVLGALALVQHALGMLTYSYSFATLVLGLIALCAAYLLGRSFVSRAHADRAMLFICGGLAAGAILSVLAQWFQIFGVRGLPEWFFAEVAERDPGPFRPFANLAQVNHLATYLSFGCVALIYLRRRGLPLAPTLIGLAWLAAGLSLTGSRMGMLLLAALLGLCFAPTGLRSTCARERWLVFAAIGAGYAAATLAGPWLQQMTGSVESPIQRVGQGNFGYRWIMWRDALSIALDNPFLGIGIGEYGRVQYEMASHHPLTVATPYAHNLVLEVAAQFGIPTALLLVGVAAWWALAQLRTRMQSPETATAWFMLFILAIHSMFEWPLWHLYFAIPAALLFALGEPAVRPFGGSINMRRVAALPSVAAIGLLAIMKADFDDVALAYGRLASAQAAGLPPQLESVMHISAMANATFFKPQADRMLLALYPPKFKPDAATIDLARRVLSRVAEDVVLARFISLLALAGRYEDSAAAVERMRVLVPNADRFASLRSSILNAISDIGPEADRLRAELHR